MVEGCEELHIGGNCESCWKYKVNLSILSSWNDKYL